MKYPFIRTAFSLGMVPAYSPIPVAAGTININGTEAEGALYYEMARHFGS
jgi:hypothetical protein